MQADESEEEEERRFLRANNIASIKWKDGASGERVESEWRASGERVENEWRCEWRCEWRGRKFLGTSKGVTVISG
jgi:hypothetical protein